MDCSEYRKLLDLGEDKSEVHYYWAKLHDSMITSQMTKCERIPWFIVEK